MPPITSSEPIPLRPVTNAPHEQNKAPSTSEVRVLKPAAPTPEIPSRPVIQDDAPPFAAESSTIAKGKDPEQVSGSSHLSQIGTVDSSGANPIGVSGFKTNVQPSGDAGLASRQRYSGMRFSVYKEPMKAVNQIFRTSVSTGYKAFGKLHRDDFLSAFSPRMTWDVDQQFGGQRDDNLNRWKTSISPEEIWDLYWHPLIWHDWVRLAGPSPVTSDGAPIRAEWNVIGYTQLLHENSDRLAYTAHVRDQYTILPSGRLVISARVWRTVTILLPNHYVSIRRPDEGAPWAPVQFLRDRALLPAPESGTAAKEKDVEQDVGLPQIGAVETFGAVPIMGDATSITNRDPVQPFPADTGLAARQHYSNARLSVHNWPIKALDQIFKTSVSTGYKAFGKLHRDDFLSTFSPQMTWNVDQQFGGWRDDDPNKRKTSICPEEIWDLYWHPLIRHDWVRLAGPSSVALDGKPIHAEWNVIGYTRLPHKNSDNVAYKAHVRDEYTILPSGRLVISARVWRTVTIPLRLHYVSIRRPDDGGQWSAAGEQEQPRHVVVIIKLISWLLRLKRWMAPMIAAAAIAASIQNIGITGSAGLVLAALGIFTAIWSLCILAADYIKDIIIYLHGLLVKAWVRRYNTTLNGQLV